MGGFAEQARPQAPPGHALLGNLPDYSDFGYRFRDFGGFCRAGQTPSPPGQALLGNLTDYSDFGYGFRVFEGFCRASQAPSPPDDGPKMPPWTRGVRHDRFTKLFPWKKMVTMKTLAQSKVGAGCVSGGTHGQRGGGAEPHPTRDRGTVHRTGPGPASPLVHLATRVSVSRADARHEAGADGRARPRGSCAALSRPP